MAGKSGIEWTDCTWNPTRGCLRVSPGCKNCYAEKVAHRFSGPGLPYEGLVTLGTKGPRWNGRSFFLSDALDAPLRWRKPRKVFVDSMSDLFFEGFTDPQIDQVLTVMLLAYRHTFQVLTKRPERMASYLSDATLYERVLKCASQLRAEHPKLQLDRVGISDPAKFPAKWIWWGTSIEDQQRADERIPHLLRTPAAVRFVSYEPALGPVDFDLGRCEMHNRVHVRLRDGEEFCAECSADGWSGELSFGCWLDPCASASQPGINWVIIGGESGPGARPFDVAWARAAVEQCKRSGVAVFVKQIGSLRKEGEFYCFQNWVNKARSWIGGTKARCYDVKMRRMRNGSDFMMADKEGTFPVSFYLPARDQGKGGDMAKWPEDVRVREFPGVQS